MRGFASLFLQPNCYIFSSSTTFKFNLHACERIPLFSSYNSARWFYYLVPVWGNEKHRISFNCSIWNDHFALLSFCFSFSFYDYLRAQPTFLHFDLSFHSSVFMIMKLSYSLSLSLHILFTNNTKMMLRNSNAVRRMPHQ